tara:strand:- start:9 stop:329 length:321 start_codon:yes stop_codon:yes gene_type:complete
MKLFKILGIIVVFVFFTSSCNSVKKTLSNENKNTGDEFLVLKKNPLVLPPNFKDLPIPGNEILEEENEKKIDLSKVLTQSKNENKDKKLKTSNPLEKSLSNILNKK